MSTNLEKAEAQLRELRKQRKHIGGRGARKKLEAIDMWVLLAERDIAAMGIPVVDSE